MKRTSFLVLMCLIVAISISCASAPVQRQENNDIQVLIRAEELIGAMHHSDFGKVWDMATPWHRQELSQDDSREGYVKWASKFFEHVKVADYDSSKLIVLDEKYAVTQAEITYEFKARDQALILIKCERTLWLKFSNGWYWQESAMPCDYMPNVKEIERLTSDLR